MQTGTQDEKNESPEVCRPEQATLTVLFSAVKVLALVRSCTCVLHFLPSVVSGYLGDLALAADPAITFTVPEVGNSASMVYDSWFSASL